MRARLAIVVTGLCLASQAASAGASGNAALSLAARIGDRSPHLSLPRKGLLGVYLDGRRPPATWAAARSS